MNIFIGNLSFEAKETDVLGAFASFGKVDSVVIVMDKNGKKSRGFGFVEMPEEQEAKLAIDALNGKEILGRPVNVMPALAKEQKTPVARHNKSADGQGFPLKRTGKYRQGRRTISYMKQRIDAGLPGAIPERKFKANPLRWRKKSKWATAYKKPDGESKPWIKSDSRKPGPWKKEGESKPWIKSDSKKPGFYKKPDGESKPWIKSSSRKPGPWKKPDGKSKPWIKSDSRKPWKKSGGKGFKK
ncbi:MAG: hypothetical protein PHY35_02675 [Candidatus Omnitrophica bacterium]|nr:hypothetical protein [Candidatus Omnitrophota bacterium]